MFKTNIMYLIECYALKKCMIFLNFGLLFAVNNEENDMDLNDNNRNLIYKDQYFNSSGMKF